MRVVETMYNKVPHWLVFNGMEIVGTFKSKEMAYEWMKQEIEQNKQAQNA